MSKLKKSYPKPIPSVIRWFNTLMIITIASAIITVVAVLIKTYNFQNEITLPLLTTILAIISIISAIWSIKLELKMVYPNSNIHNIIIVYILAFLIIATTFLNFVTIDIAPKLFESNTSRLTTESTILILSLSVIITIISSFFTFNDIPKGMNLIPIIIGFVPFVIDTIIIVGIIIFANNSTSLPITLIILPTTIPLALYLCLLTVQKIECSIYD